MLVLLNQPVNPVIQENMNGFNHLAITLSPFSLGPAPFSVVLFGHFLVLLFPFRGLCRDRVCDGSCQC
jgi:hypothetical protein